MFSCLIVIAVGWYCSFWFDFAVGLLLLFVVDVVGCV